MMSPLLGHQGGWDEALWFLIPVAVALIAVRFVERAQRRRREDEPSEPEQSPNDPS
jgi:hypothetical protein